MLQIEETLKLISEILISEILISEILISEILISEILISEILISEIVDYPRILSKNLLILQRSSGFPRRMQASFA